MARAQKARRDLRLEATCSGLNRLVACTTETKQLCSGMLYSA